MKKMNNFEESLQRLEELSAQIKKSDISLEDALSSFEEGIKLAKGMQKELDSIEGQIQKLMNCPTLAEDVQVSAPVHPELGLFDSIQEINGTRS